MAEMKVLDIEYRTTNLEKTSSVGAVGSIAVGTFPVLGKDGLDHVQQAFWDELTLGSRGFFTGGADAKRLPDLYNAWLQFPEFGQIMLRLAETVRDHGHLSPKLRELVILTTSALLGARVEYEFHIPFARELGLSEDVINAIGDGEPPSFADETERAVFQANVELVKTATLSESTRVAILKIVGYRGLMHLIAAIGLYTIVAQTTNIARVRLAEDFSADPDQLSRFFTQGEGEYGKKAP